jgi:hypothetical protein
LPPPQSAALPAWYVAAQPAPYKAVAVPNSNPSQVPALVPADGSSGLPNTVHAWAGMWYDSKGRLNLSNGGHNDNWKNLHFRFNLRSDSPGWSLFRPHTPQALARGGANYYADGEPTTRHTYNSLWEIERNGRRFLARINSIAGSAFYGTPLGMGGGADVHATTVDAWDAETSEFIVLGDLGKHLSGESGAAQLPDGSVYIWTTANAVYKFDPAAMTLALQAALPGVEGNGGSIAYDPTNNRILHFGGRARAALTYWTIGSKEKVTATLVGPGAAEMAALMADTTEDHGYGVITDKHGVVYLFTNAAAVYRIDPRNPDLSLHVERVTLTGEKFSPPVNGWWGRVKYDPVLHAAVTLGAWNSPVITIPLP